MRDANAAPPSREDAARATILVVGDDPDTRAFLAEMLGDEGFHVVTAARREAALTHVASEPPAVVLLDLSMTSLEGLETLRRLRMITPQIPVIIHGDTSSTIQAMDLGAAASLTKPFDIGQLLVEARRAVERPDTLWRSEDLEPALEGSGALGRLMGPSRAIENVVQQIRQIADSNFTILLQGETGTGKELVARAIHELSPRRGKPFVALDCGAIPETLIESELFGYEKGAFTGADRRKEGYFELAAGGSLFFDEITNLPVTTQAKLLRVLQERRVQPLGGRRTLPVDVRVLAAFNVRLADEIRAGRFREDLYYRLNEFVIMLPPLRERRDDIPHLARRFLTEAARELRRPVRGLADEAIDVLVEYPWPGNVRELRNVIRRAAVLASDLIGPEHLRELMAEGLRPAVGRPEQSPLIGRPLKVIVEAAAAEVENRAIRQALQTARGKKREAARLLQIDSKTLYMKMKRHRIHAGYFVS